MEQATIQQAIQTAKSLQANGLDGASAINMLASQNPAYQEVANIVNQNGGNLQAAAMQMMQQRGLDANSMIQSIRSCLGNK